MGKSIFHMMIYICMLPLLLSHPIYLSYPIYLGDQSPMDFFRQEASHSDPVVRADAVRRVGLIAALAGAERTRADLLPFLQGKRN